MTHFYHDTPAAIRALSHREAVEQYAAGAEAPARAIADLPGDVLTAFPIPGTWSLQQIIVHMLDSDLVASVRMKRIIAEDHPRLELYDETRFADLLHYHEIDTADACEAFRTNRLVTTHILRRLRDEDFERTGEHPEAGSLTLGQLVRSYVHHVEHHLAFIERKKAMLTHA